MAEGLALRPGVAELVTAAQEEGWTLGLVTTTWPPTLDAVFDGLVGALRREAFSIVIDRTLSGACKPDPRCYELALEQAGLGPEAAIAVEDTPESVASARGAGAMQKINKTRNRKWRIPWPGVENSLASVMRC